METAPRIDVSVDKATVASELNTTNMLTFTVTGSDGFTGDVTLSASVVDAAQAPLAGWTITLDKTTLTIPTNGTGTAVGTLVIPSENKGLTGTVKVTATTAVPRATGTMLATSTVNVTNQITFTEKLNANGQCVYPAAENVKVTIGTAIRFLNTDTVKNITTHIQGVNNTTGGLQHQPDPGSAPGTAYVQTATKAGSNSWYCHAPGPDPGPILVIQSVP